MIDKINNAVEFYSNYLIENAENLHSELRSAKNYVCTPGYKHWSYGKLLWEDIETEFDGGAVKRKLYRLGYYNALQDGDIQYKEFVIKKFLDWAKKVKYPIEQKFHNNKAFELLVHKSVSKSIITHSTIDSFDEGFKNELQLEVSYRNRGLIAQARMHYDAKCEVCGFVFEDTYGKHGAGFIEIHHLNPIALGKRKSTIEDVRPVCANCHRMLHRGTRILSIQELKDIIANNKA